jgi:alpha-tubulin suppressor-like RCC1 family protein
VIGISAGGRHTCALTNEGGMKCWGLNASGQIGDGTTIMRNTPVDVIGLNSGVIDISAGNQHTCALTNEGKVKCWGLNFAGQLGDGSYIDRYTPVDVIGLIGENKWISAGYEFTCAINGLSEALCWGKNEFGNLGDGTTANYRNLPVEVFGLSDP